MLQVARLDVRDGDTSPRVREATPIPVGRGERVMGEYVPIVFLREGGLGVVAATVTGAGRAGFTWSRFQARQ